MYERSIGQGVKLLGLDLQTEREVYEPAEDTLLIAGNLDAQPGELCLDIGTGCGALALVMARDGGRTLATDVSPLACRLARGNARRNGLEVEVVQTALARGLERSFDLIACNPPYLPTSPEERVKGPLNRAFDGGADGAEVTRDVIETMAWLLRPADEGGRGYLLVSDKQPLARLKGLANMLGLSWDPVENASYGGEGLACIRVQRVGQGHPTAPW